jgi:hypothetical protein
MSKGGASGSTTSTTSIDPDLKAAYLANIQQGQSVAGALPVRQFAGFNPLYTAGEEQLINTGLGGPGIGSVDQAAYQTGMAGAYQPQMVGGFGGGRAAMSGATGYGASDVTAAQANMADIGQYMNPYTQNVTRNTLADLEIGRQNAVRQIAQQAGAAKAFGGSRQGVAEAQTNIGFGTEAGKLLAQLNEQAYNSAMNAQQQDLARQQQAMLANQGAGLSGAQLRLSAAGQLGNLGAQQQGLRMSGAQAAMGAGSARQQLLQQQMDAQRNIGLQKLGIAQSAFGQGLPNMGQTTTTPYSRNVGAGALGGALAGAQLGSAFPGVGTGIGAALGGLLGLF